MVRLFKRLFASILRTLTLLFVVSCSYEHPIDLRLEQVYVADRTAIPEYKVGTERGVVQRKGLIIELTTSEAFPDGVFVVDGFCGEPRWAAQLGDGRLYRATNPNDEAGSDRENQGSFGRYRYLVIVDIVSKHIAPPPRWPTFDLRTDRRDICINTAAGTGYVSQRSNEVRVPRSQIDKALREAPQPGIPLNTKQLK